jgi:phospholipid/cholesterol/gamma-HCH transport system ATP-binding protein
MSTPEAPSHAGSLEVAPGSQKIIVFDKVSLAFEENVVLEGVSFHLEHGETKTLLGVAGTGKTLILKLALGLLKPDRGHIYVLGNDVTAMREEELFALRRRIGMVFQESALFDSLTVKENVGYRLREEGTPEGEAEERVLEALRFVELEHTINMFPSELSGGMRRRVAIARAIITQPEVLLYDSPTAGLDPITSTTIIELVVKQRDVYRTSALMVTHRLQDAFIMASHCFDKQANRMRLIEKGERVEVNTSFLILREAKVIFDGTAAELARSRDEYIREYLS